MVGWGEVFIDVFEDMDVFDLDEVLDDVDVGVGGVAEGGDRWAF